jgi:uncharacterized membrane protein
MLALALAALFLLASHFGLSAAPVRDWLVARLGANLFTAVYTLVAAGAFVWLAAAYARAPEVGLWPPGAWSAWLAVLVMPLAVLLLVGGLSTPNPTVVASEAALRAAEPTQGVLRITRHPVMWAFGLWGLLHLLASGDLAGLILFGSIAFLALYGTRRIDAKYAARRPELWRRFVRATSNLPFAAILAGRQSLVWEEIGWWRLALALALYGFLLAGHPWLAGVPVLGPD